jgi:hypothetical protein
VVICYQEYEIRIMRWTGTVARTEDWGITVSIEEPDGETNWKIEV